MCVDVRGRVRIPLGALYIKNLVCLSVPEPTEFHVGQNLLWWSLLFYPLGVDHGHDHDLGDHGSIMLTPNVKPTLTRGRYAY